MKISELNKRPGILGDARSKEAFLQFEELLSELRKRELPDAIVSKINKDVHEINSYVDSGKAFRKKVRLKQTEIIKHLE